jgi:TfoX/Sxy family transcriptional regulator of competence genes
MAYDADLADRIRGALGHRSEVTERPMFGGLAFLVNGNLAVSASSRGGLLLRVDPEQTDALVTEDGVARFVMRGRAMDGWLHVAPSAASTDEQLGRWVEIGVAYAGSLSPKS